MSEPTNNRNKRCCGFFFTCVPHWIMAASAAFAVYHYVVQIEHERKTLSAGLLQFVYPILTDLHMEILNDSADATAEKLHSWMNCSQEDVAVFVSKLRILSMYPGMSEHLREMLRTLITDIGDARDIAQTFPDDVKKKKKAAQGVITKTFCFFNDFASHLGVP